MLVLVADGAKKANLLPVTPAPTTHEQMEFEADALAERQRLLGRGGLETAGVTATGQNGAKKGFHKLQFAQSEERLTVLAGVSNALSGGVVERFSLINAAIAWRLATDESGEGGKPYKGKARTGLQSGSPPQKALR